MVLINGLPFEIKSIYGMVQENADGEACAQGEQAVGGEEDQEAECLICLTEQKDTLIMPCGHYCVCNECGK